MAIIGAPKKVEVTKGEPPKDVVMTVRITGTQEWFKQFAEAVRSVSSDTCPFYFLVPDIATFVENEINEGG